MKHSWSLSAILHGFLVGTCLEGHNQNTRNDPVQSAGKRQGREQPWVLATEVGLMEY